MTRLLILLLPPFLGATGHEHPWSSTTGGTARKVANEVPCAVLLVRRVIVVDDGGRAVGVIADRDILAAPERTCAASSLHEAAA